MVLRNETGTVTAELAISLPAVLLVVTFAFQALGVQVDRIKLATQVTQLARQAARGERVVGSHIEGNQVCVQRKLQNLVSIEEQQCARLLGI